MPALGSASPATKPPPSANPFKEARALAQEALDSAKAADQAIREEAFSGAKAELEAMIVQLISKTANDIIEGTRFPGELVSCQLTSDSKLRPSNSEYSEDQFEARSLSTLDDVLFSLFRTTGLKALFEMKVLVPLRKELKEAGFASATLSLSQYAPAKLTFSMELLG